MSRGEMPAPDQEKVAAALNRLFELMTAEELEDYRSGVHEITLRYRDLPDQEARDRRWDDLIKLVESLSIRVDERISKAGIRRIGPRTTEY
jgi:hypothetical protein